jgi:glycylpeptide N-tetradecanoyltransferase
MPSKKIDPEDDKKHEFWATQPVLQSKEDAIELKKALAQRLSHEAEGKPVEHTSPAAAAATGSTAPEEGAAAAATARAASIGPIEKKTLTDVPKEPYPLASVLEWFNPDVNSDTQLQEIYDLLYENYVEDDDSMFRFSYSHPFLRWALTPPGYYPDWHIAVRKVSDKKMLAFISGVPAHIRVGDKAMTLCEINFLCVHKSLRSKKLTPILIREVTRRVNLRDIWQAVYTAGIEIPTPFATTQYWHRSLNPEKLIDIGFSRMPSQYEKFAKPMEALTRALKVEHTGLALRPMTKQDLPHVLELLAKQLAACPIAPAFEGAEAEHWLLPRKDVVHAFVHENPQTKEITDFVSFYALSSTVLNHPRHQTLNAAYAYYYANTTVDKTRLFQEALCLAKKENFDVFNALNLMGNEAVFTHLKFGIGDGKLRYYLFNYRFPHVEAREVGLIML